MALIGGTSEDVPGHAWTKYIHPDDREAVMAEGAAARANRRKFSMEYRILTKTGEERWVHTTIIATRSPVGVVTGYLGTIEDTTERRRAEDALRESEERFRFVSTSAPIGIFLADVRGHSVYSNEYAVALVGGTIEDGLGHAWTKFIHPDDREAVKAEMIVAIANSRKFSMEYRILTKAGEDLWAHTTMIATRSPEGVVTGFVGTIEDVTAFKRVEEDKQRAYENTVKLLAVAAEARDPYTESHLQRIRGYSEAIASELGLSPQEIKEIGLASLLHDLGKMRVPDAILMKPGPLSEEEWQVIRQHPIWGEALLPSHPWFRLARQVARWHHENWDGTGYPDGLSGEEIPIAAAITAVADGFDAMTTQRPYKGAWPPSRAIKEIRQSKGRRYSPKVVEAFERTLRKGEIKRVGMTSPPSDSDLTKAA